MTGLVVSIDEDRYTAARRRRRCDDNFRRATDCQPSF